MYEEITHLITECCLRRKLNSITQSMLSSHRQGAMLFTHGEVTMTNLMSWMLMRFPLSEITIATTIPSKQVLDLIARFSHKVYTQEPRTTRIKSLTILHSVSSWTLPDNADFACDVKTIPMKHNFDCVLISSTKGKVVVQGSFPSAPQGRVHSVFYSASSTKDTSSFYDDAMQIITPLIKDRM